MQTQTTDTDIKKFPYREYSAIPVNLDRSGLQDILDYLRSQGHIIFRLENNDKWHYTDHGVFVHKKYNPEYWKKHEPSYEAMFSFYKGSQCNWYRSQKNSYKFGELPPNAIIV